MEQVRAFVWEGLRARELMLCAPVFRVMDGEAFTTGATMSRMVMGIDLGLMMDRLQASAGNQRFIRFLGWVQGDLYKSLDTVERTQLEDDAMLVKKMACEAYKKMFPYD